MSAPLPFLIVGAGKVGLLLGCLLAGAGREVLVLERTQAPTGTRSIGVHPPALEALAQAGVAAEFVERGRRIERARLFVDDHRIGDFSLGSCPAPYRFVLTLPQHLTERVLERRLCELQQGALRRGEEVVGVKRSGEAIEVRLASGESLRTGFLVGADGRSSRVRAELGVPVAGGSTGDHYLMADLPDDGALAGDAAIFLTRTGVVESFPLPDAQRRWVARLPRRPEGASVGELMALVAERTGLEPALPAESGAARAQQSAASLFTAERRLAGRFAGAGWALAGDAAHVVSPIGGQGMNLGLLGALHLYLSLTAPGGPRLESYARGQLERARRAARRASLNMLLGREGIPRPLRAAALRAVLAPGVQPRMARFYTMRGV